jgi:hypothetical protein
MRLGFERAGSLRSVTLYTHSAPRQGQIVVCTYLSRHYELTPTFESQSTPPNSLAFVATMSFSSLVSDIAYRTSEKDDMRSQLSRARSYASTAATSVSISGDISSQLHGGYSHPLARAWQAERQLTKVRNDVPLYSAIEARRADLRHSRC